MSRLSLFDDERRSKEKALRGVTIDDLRARMLEEEKERLGVGSSGLEPATGDAEKGKMEQEQESTPPSPVSP